MGSGPNASCGAATLCGPARRMADRGTAAARNPRGHAEEVWLQATRPGRRTGEDRDLQWQLGAPLWSRKACRHRAARPFYRAEGRLRQERPGPQQPALRLRGAAELRDAAAPTLVRVLQSASDPA